MNFFKQNIDKLNLLCATFNKKYGKIFRIIFYFWFFFTIIDLILCFSFILIVDHVADNFNEFLEDILTLFDKDVYRFNSKELLIAEILYYIILVYPGTLLTLIVQYKFIVLFILILYVIKYYLKKKR